MLFTRLEVFLRAATVRGLIATMIKGKLSKHMALLQTAVCLELYFANFSPLCDSNLGVWDFSMFKSGLSETFLSKLVLT